MAMNYKTRQLRDTRLSKMIVFIFILTCLPNSARATISILSELSNSTIATIEDSPARFIPDRFSFYKIEGFVIYSNPPSACTKVVPPPNPSPVSIDHPISWILLAKRSADCHFQTKIENAQKAGYTAIIVHNVGSNDTEVMGVEDPSQIIIYSTFVGEYDGMLLKNFSYFNRKGYYVRIQDEFNINVYIWPFAVVVGLCFIVMIFFMVRLLWQQVIRCIRERRRSRRRKLPASALKKIPTKKWTKGDPYETCAVCLEDFVEQEKIRVLPCSHGYHIKCIDPWLTKGRRVCPICKRKVVVADEQFRDSDTDTEDESAPLLGTSAPSTSQTPEAGEGTFVQNEEEQTEVQRDESGRTRRFFGRQHRMVPVESDSSSMTSVSSQSASSGADIRTPGPSSSHHSRSVLAEVHQSSEILKHKIDEMEQQRDLSSSESISCPSRNQNEHPTFDSHTVCTTENGAAQDNAVFIPEFDYTSEELGTTNPQYSSPDSEVIVPADRHTVLIPVSSQVGVHTYTSNLLNSNSNPNV